MMIKEVAEEIGVHHSTVSRTVAKYREDLNIPSTHQRRRRDG
jgi:DNA-directed RNA polymerase specialized sigma54-like protein